MSQAAHLLPAAARPGRVELRRMRWWDIPGVILLEHAAFPEDAWSVGMFWSELAEAATRYYLVAEEYAPATVHTHTVRSARGADAVGAGAAGHEHGVSGAEGGPAPRRRARPASASVSGSVSASAGGSAGYGNGAYGSLGDEGSAAYGEAADEAASVYESAAFAEDDDDEGPALIGYAGLLAGIGEAEVLTIAVDPKREGRGLGAVLLTELLREAARRDCDDVVLEVRVDNERAQQLYRRFGFAGIGVRKGYYQPMNIDALVMRSSDVIARFGDGYGTSARGCRRGAEGRTDGKRVTE